MLLCMHGQFLDYVFRQSNVDRLKVHDKVPTQKTELIPTLLTSTPFLHRLSGTLPRLHPSHLPHCICPVRRFLVRRRPILAKTIQ